MSGAADGAATQAAPDYYARAQVLWPRLRRGHASRFRNDPRRIARLISRRTNLSQPAILGLLGAPGDDESRHSHDD